MMYNGSMVDKHVLFVYTKQFDMYRQEQTKEIEPTS